MLNAVLYRADGTIVQSMSGSEGAIEKTAARMSLHYLVIDAFRNDYDVTHKVANFALVAIDG